MRNKLTYWLFRILLLVLGLQNGSKTFAADLVKNENDGWSFYWQQLLSQDEIKSNTNQPIAIVNFPNYWTDISSDSIEITGEGYGTYYKQFVVDHRNVSTLGIRLEGIDVAYKLIINNELIEECGRIGKNWNEEIPGYQSEVFQFKPKSDTIDIIIQVSNFHHRRGGIWKRISIDEYKTTYLKAEKDEFADYVSLSILLSFGIFFSLFHLYNPQEKSLPLFGLAFIGIFLSGIATNFYPLIKVSNISWTNNIRIEYLGHFLTLSLLAWAFYNVLPLKWHKIFSIALSSSLGILAIITIVVPVTVFSFTILIFYGLLAIAILATIVQFIQGLKSNFRVSIIIIIGIAFLFFAAINDTILSLGKESISAGYVLPKVFVLFILVLSIGFFKAYSNRFNKEKNLRNDLSLVNSSLENAIDTRTKELLENEQTIKSQNETLENENYLKNKILSIIGHDLRSPIASIIQDLELMDLIDDKKLHKDAIENVKHSTETLYIMVDDMLTWALNKDKRLKYNPETANIKDIVSNIITQNQFALRNKNINITNTIDESKLVICDINSLKIAVRNLLSNAIKFTPNDGEISIKSSYGANEIIIELCDNGVGMTNEQIKEILEGDSFTSKEGTNKELGTGLGLSLVKDFIKLNKGNLFIKSEIGKGTCFSFTLPLA